MRRIGRGTETPAAEAHSEQRAEDASLPKPLAVKALQGVTAVLCATYAIWAMFGTADNVPARDLWLYTAILAAAVLLLAARVIMSETDRWAWALLAIGILSWAIANYLFTAIIAELPDPPYPSFCDWLYLAFYPFAFAAVALLFVRRVKHPTIKVWLDGLLVALGVAGMMTLELPAIYASQPNTWTQAFISIAAPISDLILVSMLIAVLGVCAWKADQMWWMLAAGAVILWASNTAWLLNVEVDRPNVAALLDAGWLVAFMLMGWAGWVKPRLELRLGAGFRAATVPLLVTACSFGLLLYATQENVPEASIILAGAAMVLGLGRITQVLHEVSTLAEVRRQLHMDELTGLANRRLLDMQFAQLATQPGGLAACALLILDVDAFKDVNDELGHEAGDTVLREMAPRLLQGLRTTDIVARLGGDEFAILLGPGTNIQGAVAVASRIKEGFRRPMRVVGMDLQVGASIGIALCPDHATTPADLLRAADLAMYRAKNQRLEYAVFNTEFDHPQTDRLQLMGQLRKGMTNAELTCDFQPILDLKDDSVPAVEALVRWQHPERGRLYPGDFLAHAERAGLMTDLTACVLELSLSAIAQLRADGHAVNVAVNLSPSTLFDTSLPSMVADSLAKYELPGSVLILEVTETVLVSDPTQVELTIGQLHAMGIALSIDDYGTGYSSLSQLRHICAAEIKIDRSFVTGLSGEFDSQAIVRATTDMARDLGLRVVAEGVESEQDLCALRELGCDLAQGYFICRPLPEARLMEWFRQRGSGAIPAMREATGRIAPRRPEELAR